MDEKDFRSEMGAVQLLAKVTCLPACLRMNTLLHTLAAFPLR